MHNTCRANPDELAGFRLSPLWKLHWRVRRMQKERSKKIRRGTHFASPGTSTNQTTGLNDKSDFLHRNAGPSSCWREDPSCRVETHQRLAGLLPLAHTKLHFAPCNTSRRLGSVRAWHACRWPSFLQGRPLQQGRMHDAAAAAADVPRNPQAQLLTTEQNHINRKVCL